MNVCTTQCAYCQGTKIVLFVPLAAAAIGGAVHIQGNGTRVSMQSCVFSNNTAQWGAGLSLYGSPTGKLTFELIVHCYVY